jgi:DNA polymerase-3 subunit epsilon
MDVTETGNGVSLRAIVFDTETTGLEPLNGDRVIEIAALELINDLPTGKYFHAVLDPQRDVPAEASRVHGFFKADLEGKPLFASVAEEMLAFFGDSRLIAHNAPFDFGFLDMELGRLKRPPLNRSRMIDSLALAKTRFPGMPNSLDALCRRFAIDLSARTTHNALLDCKLLAEVYVELTGGRQRGLSLASDRDGRAPVAVYTHSGPRTPRPVVPSEDELAAHDAFVTKKVKEAVWLAA